MTVVSQITSSAFVRRTALAWRHGDLAPRVAGVGTGVLLLILAASAWQGLRLQHQIERLDRRAAQLQSALAAKTAAVDAALPPDVVQTLPDAPAVAQIMQTLQQAADKEGARVESLQADDHPATDTALGHLDLVLSIKAPYPSILVVLQQVLDRYPGATLKQINLAPVVPQTAAVPMAITPSGGPTALASTSPTEARVLLSFWRRPPGVAHADADVAATPLSSARDGQASAAQAASAAAFAPSVAAPGARPVSGAR